MFGQTVQKFSSTVCETFRQHKRRFKQVQELCLVFIVYIVFYRMFEEEAGAGLADVFLMTFSQMLLIMLVMALSWCSPRQFFKNESQL